MKEVFLTNRVIEQYMDFLCEEERSAATRSKYLRDIRGFFAFMGDEPLLTKSRVIEYKAHLGQNYKVSSANSMLAAVNGLLSWMGAGECRVKSFKNQRQVFCESSRELSKQEYEKLIKAAQDGRQTRLEMIMQTICATGIRIGELPFITVEAVRQGKAVVACKGKSRTILITPKLRKYLLQYCRSMKISKGAVFITKHGAAVDRSNVWKEMKALCKAAGVDKGKVFPHNFRHLFARTCYEKKKDIVYLADILGHSNIETTRIYTISSGKEHERLIGSLELII